MSEKIKELWKCGRCDEIHEWEDEARDCCAPDITELYGCVECDEVHDDEIEAINCCSIGSENVQCPECLRDHGKLTINATSVNVVGHCSFCNPLYSPDQVFKIEDTHLLNTGNQGCIERGISNVYGTQR
tara:strand:- start:3622 stop:4008 length:387 start_codon:yes stop_codon:yes gene_type:complete